MAESQNTQSLQAQAREAVLNQIVEIAPRSGSASQVKDLAEAYALVVSADEEDEDNEGDDGYSYPIGT